MRKTAANLLTAGQCAAALLIVLWIPFCILVHEHIRPYATWYVFGYWMVLSLLFLYIAQARCSACGAFYFWRTEGSQAQESLLTSGFVSGCVNCGQKN